MESLSVQSNVSHSSSIKVKDSGDRAEQRSAHHVQTPPSARAQDKSRHVQTAPDSPGTRASVEGSRKFHNHGEEAPINLKCESASRRFQPGL